MRVGRCEKLLIIPDAHAHPSYDNGRFDLLGRLMEKEKPDVVVCLGDFADMPSLSAYDKGKRSFEGRRYRRDVEAARDAMNRMGGGFDHNPRMIMLLGNHEHRIVRATNDHPELDGAISIDDLGYERFGWEVVPYEECVEIAGFSISHHFASGVNGKPIGGEHCAANLIAKLHTSAIVGHNHLLDVAIRTRPNGKRLVGISAGCLTHPRHVEGWNKGTHRMWWRGVVILDDARDGDFGALRCVTLEQMRRLYGRRRR